VPAERLHAWRLAMDRHLQYGFPGLAKGGGLLLADRRTSTTRAQPGAPAARAGRDPPALPVVLAPKTPLIFREWHPGVEMALGKLVHPLSQVQSRGDADRGAAAG